MFKAITVKEVYKNNDLEHIELWQNGNCIRVSFGSTTLETQKDPSKWENLKAIVDEHASRAKEYAALKASTLTRFYANETKEGK